MGLNGNLKCEEDRHQIDQSEIRIERGFTRSLTTRMSSDESRVEGRDSHSLDIPNEVETNVGTKNSRDTERTARQNQYIAELREQDRWLPINNVSRLMKNTLPVTAKVSKDAKECMQECVSEFISFVTSEASDRCAADKRKTINGEDILISLHALGFENYAEVLKIYLAKYRQQQALKNQLWYEEEEGQADTDGGSEKPQSGLQGEVVDQEEVRNASIDAESAHSQSEQPTPSKD